MPYRGGWLIPLHAIESRMSGRVTMEDSERHLDVCEELLTLALEQAPGNRVHLLYDTLDAESFPPLYLGFSGAARVLRFQNRGVMFLVVRNTAIRSVIEIAARLGGRRGDLRVFRKRQDAIDALYAQLAREGVAHEAAGHTAPG